MDKTLIINVAFKLIIDNGLEGFSIAKLANELECTKSSIYNYFKSKDDLLNQIFIEKTSLLAMNISPEDDPEEVIRTYAHNCINNRDVFSFFHKYAHSNFINKETMCEIRREMEMTKNVVSDLVGRYASNSNTNPVIVEALIFGPIHGLVFRIQSEKNMVTDQDVDVLVDFILSTIRKEENERNN